MGHGAVDERLVAGFEQVRAAPSVMARGQV
jgi:hypothetical protein